MKCRICGEEHKQLGPHLGRKHPGVGIAYYTYNSDQLRPRIEEKITIVGESDCWMWRGAKSNVNVEGKGAYGMVVVYGKTFMAHRVSWWAFRGAIPPPEIIIRHTCDAPLCVNPEHLLMGTHKDNRKDAMERGRAYIPSFKGHRHTSDAKKRISETMKRTLAEKLRPAA